MPKGTSPKGTSRRRSASLSMTSADGLFDAERCTSKAFRMSLLFGFVARTSLSL